MLPLPLYFSDAFKLITTPQLLRGVQQAALRETAALQQALAALELTFSDLPTLSPQTAAFAEYCPPPPAPAVLTTERANHYFNVCLKRIESGRPTHPATPALVLVDPTQLQPNCHPDAGIQQTGALVRKLIALARIAHEHQVRLLLSLPQEAELELWLQLLEHLLIETESEAEVGIELSAHSSRLLPTLGYLERLGQDHRRHLLIRLFQHDYRVSADGTTLSATTIRLNLTAACAFLESDNSSQLRPQLVLKDPALATTLHSLHQNHDWSISLLGAQVARPALHTLPSAASPLDGLQIITERLEQIRTHLHTLPPRSHPIIAGISYEQQAPITTYQPGAPDTACGTLIETTEEQVRMAFACCTEALPPEPYQSIAECRQTVDRFALLLTKHQLEVATLCALETGKPIRDCLLEIQAAQLLLRQHLQLSPQVLSREPLLTKGTSSCHLQPAPIGVVLALLPWSQPIFQFCAMTSAALLTGNTLLIKPALQASQIVTHLFSLLLQSGIDATQMALLPGRFESSGQFLLDDYRLDGVLLCGNAYAATEIRRRLNQRLGAPMLSILSDTGGRHAAIIDADQSPNALLPGLLRAAFAVSGQHPASLRVLYVEEKIADQVERGLIQALPHLRLGAPERRATDLGPLVSRELMERNHLHIERFRTRGCLIAQPTLKPELEEGYFVPPALLRLYTLDELQEQIDGPLLHLVRFNREEIARPLDEINRSGFGMSLTLFSNDPALCEQVTRRARVREFSLNPSELHPHSLCCPGIGQALSGSAPRPGTAHYLRALIRHQLIQRPLVPSQPLS